MEFFNCDTKGLAPRIIVGIEGISKDMLTIRQMHMDSTRWALFTNNPLLVDDAKDVSRLGYSQVYIWDMEKHDFVMSQDLTQKALRDTNIFSRLWLGDVFKNSKQYH